VSAEPGGAGPPDRARGPGPHFLGIGSSRCGTTFLHWALRRHPDVWLPPIKELHYFDRRGAPRRKRASDPDGGRPRRGLRGLRKARRALLRGDSNALADARFVLRYHLGGRELTDYRAWFRAGGRRVTGEITPGYCILEDAEIARIRGELPELRLIFVMRDPIDRAWSAAYKSLVRDAGRAAASVPEEAWRKKLLSPGLARRSDYLGILDRWGRHFESDRIFIGFFEDLQAEPVRFLGEIGRFLGVGPLPSSRTGSIAPRNASGGSTCPPELERLLAERFLEPTRRLHERFGSHATGWYRRVLRILDSAPAARSEAPPAST
jgi:hypothetical protein